MALEAGRILHDRYRLIRPIGHGSQASVWIAEHLALTTTVAVKLIDPELAKKESARERFRREATAAAQLRSAHVVQILDHGIEGDQPFIVMELLDGEDLFERLTHRTRISLRETSKVVTQVARALTRAHAAGIVHRDLKPENIFLVPNDDDEVVKVLDFGVAKFKDPGKAAMQRTGLGTLIGTPHYMSPEQVKGISEIDYRADLWALGVIAFQCVTGELPFDSEGVEANAITGISQALNMSRRIGIHILSSLTSITTLEALSSTVRVPLGELGQITVVSMREQGKGKTLRAWRAKTH